MSKCIEWNGGYFSDGYGRKWSKKKRNWIRAHRWVYEQEVGPIPKGLMVRHLCHNRACVNPEHLAVGTAKDNRQDDILAGKDWFRGEKNSMCVHSDKIIDEIYALKPNGKPPYGYIRDLAKKYDINRTTIHRIWSGNYRHIKE